MAQKMANMGKNSHEGVYRLKMASSSLFVFFNVHTDGSKWDLRWTALDPRSVSVQTLYYRGVGASPQTRIGLFDHCVAF